MCILAALSRTFSRILREQSESSGKGTEAGFAVIAWGKVLSDESPKQANQQHWLPTIHVTSVPTNFPLVLKCHEYSLFFIFKTIII